MLFRSTPDDQRFPALDLARQALISGGAAPTILNAANEIAVAGFLNNEIGFLEISRVVEDTLRISANAELGSLEEVFAVDFEARRVATAAVGRLAGRA